ncbi:MAG: GDP-L-fucose synthase, partial [Actinobacteria bacterium]|nr:GDP-L-fucose synthase [Actinomycetota bacterium]
VLDISRIKALGWSPSVGITEGVRETITWYRENQSRVRA